MNWYDGFDFKIVLGAAIVHKSKKLFVLKLDENI
jgi:hypothetical protein